MESINKNEKKVKLLKSITNSQNSPINKSPTTNFPNNRKKIESLQNMTENELIKNNNTYKRNYFSENLNKKYFNEKDNNFENSLSNNNINNRVINININYNDKYNYYNKYQKNNKDKKDFFDFGLLNYNIGDKKIKQEINSTKKNKFLELNLTSANTSKIKDKILITNKNTISPKPQNSFINNQYMCKTIKNKKIIKDNNKINTIKTIIVKSNNINTKRKLIESINNNSNKFVLNEIDLINNISNLIENENIILFLNEKNKIETRIKGFYLLNEFILNEVNIDIIGSNINNFFMFIYFKLNYFQEKNIVLIIEGMTCILHLFELIINKKDIYIKNKKDIDINIIENIINILKEKIKNLKLKNIFFKFLNILIKLYSIKEIFDILLDNISTNDNNIEIIKEYLIFIKRNLETINSINKSNIKTINIQKLLNFIIQVVNIDNSSDLFLLSSKIIYLLSKIYGSSIKEYLKEKNQFIFNLIEKELIRLENDNNDNLIETKKKIIKQSKSSLLKKSKNVNNQIQKINTNNNLRINISKYLTPLLISEISSTDFNTKKNAIDYINKLIVKYKKISINGLKNLFLVIKKEINNKDENSAFLVIEMLNNLISAIGPQIKIYSNSLIYPLLLNLSNKSQKIREISFVSLEKWIKVHGFISIIFYLPKLLNNENNNITMKLEILKLLLNNYNLIDIESNEELVVNLCKSLLNCLINNSLIIRNISEKLIQKLKSLIRKDLYIEEINNCNKGIKEKEYLYKKINELFSNCNINKKNINKIMIKNINKNHKQNSFNNKQIILLSGVNSENEKNVNINNPKKRNALHFKQKFLGRRNKSIFSNNSINTFNLNSHTLPLNHSSGYLNKKREKNSLLINNKTIKSFLRHVRNQSLNLLQNSNDNININRFSTNNNSSLPIRRKKTEIDTFNKLIFSSIILPSKMKNKLNFEDKSKLLPDEVKQEIKRIKTMQNLKKIRISNNKRLLTSSGKKKKLSNILKINHNNNSINKNNYFSQVLETDIPSKRNNLFNENSESNIFSPNYTNNPKKEKQIRYEDDKKINFDIKEMLNTKNIYNIKNYSKNILTYDFIQNIFNDDVENIILYLSQLNKLIDNSIVYNNEDMIQKIIDNLDIFLKMISPKLTKYKNDSLNKTFFIFVYSIIKLSKVINYKFNETEISLFLYILCDKLNNNKKIIKETSYNLILFLGNQCENRTFLIILSKLLKYQGYQNILEIIKIIQNICHNNNYNKEIMIEIVEDISKIYFYKFYDYENKKNEIILPLLNKIFDSIGNQFWEKCTFLSSEKKEILSKNMFEFKNNSKNQGDKLGNIDENDNDLILINKNINLSSKKNKIYINYKTDIYKGTTTRNPMIKYINNNDLKENSINKIIKRNKTSNNLIIFHTPQDILSKYSSNNLSLELKYLISEENNKNKENIIENKLLNTLKKINLDNSNEIIIINACIELYNLIYTNCIKYKNIILKNIDNILNIIINKINTLLENFKEETKIIKLLFNTLYKLFFIENFIKNISFKIHQKLLLLLIKSLTNKNFNIINEKNNDNINNIIINDSRIIFETINSIIGIIAKNLDITNNILIIINIINNNRKKSIKIIDYSINILLSEIKNIKEKYLSLNINLIINEIQILLNNIEHEEKNLKIKITCRESIINVIKSLIFEMFKYKKEEILDVQKNIENNNIKNWIENILRNNNSGHLFEGETFYPRKNENNNNLELNYSREGRIETNFKNIKKKWTKIHKK